MYSDVSRETLKQQSGRFYIKTCRPAVMWGVKEKDMVMGDCRFYAQPALWQANSLGIRTVNSMLSCVSVRRASAFIPASRMVSTA